MRMNQNNKNKMAYQPSNPVAVVYKPSGNQHQNQMPTTSQLKPPPPPQKK